LIVEKKSLPDSLQITAWTKDKEIMGLAHKKFPIWGVQFHPESILTKEGKKLLNNFINI
jgi:anthranilate synthase component 2